MAHIDVKFNEIKEKYEETNPYNKTIHDDLIFKVFMENTEPVDIIKFYNSVFIARLKGFTKFLQERSQGNNVFQDRKNLVLQSPLKTIIPKDMNKVQKKTMMNKNVMTPQTSLLYAYHESPLLRNDFHHNFKGNITKTNLDLEEGDDNLSRRYEVNLQNHTNNQAHQQQTN